MTQKLWRSRRFLVSTLSPIRKEKEISGEGFMLGLKSLKLVLASGTAFAALSCATASTAFAQSAPEPGVTQPAIADRGRDSDR